MDDETTGSVMHITWKPVARLYISHKRRVIRSICPLVYFQALIDLDWREEIAGETCKEVSMK